MTSLRSTVIISFSVIINDSRTEVIGRAYVLLLQFIIRALIIASVIGRVIMKRLPLPFFVSISTIPETAEMLFFTTSIPTPRPEISLTVSFVEKPGRKIKSIASRSVTVLISLTNPFCRALILTFSTLMPPPSSSISMTT